MQRPQETLIGAATRDLHVSHFAWCLYGAGSFYRMGLVGPIQAFSPAWRVASSVEFLTLSSLVAH